jgi:uncharacterized protein YyaL (SSP411 family)
MKRPTARTVALALLFGLAVAGRASCADAAGKGKELPTNRLAKESSPYLLQHAHNPVDWFAWGPEAFAKAQKENKLIFLSIGYSSCHWCHVMERESFENAEVAKLLNDWFVSIKVDREERPDIDAIYMMALHVQGQSGGWPLSMFLTADGKPIVGGTYWPPDDREVKEGTVRGFKTILKIVHDYQVNKPETLQTQADRLATATRTALAEKAPGVALVDLNRTLIQTALEALKTEFDARYGGFGSAATQFRGPKFPVPSYLELLLHQAAQAESADAKAILTATLDHMARGGIHDQVGGGFHRYSTERTWTVPHFEKMLYDNAQLAEVYAKAYGMFGSPYYRRIVEEMLAFVDREMTAPQGGFYSALDADSDGVEGRFYVWTGSDIDAALVDRADADLVKRVFGFAGPANFESSYYIPVLAKPLTETAGELKLTEEQLHARLAPLLQKLLVFRSARPRPFLDTKILTGWNGEMIAGYAVAGQALHEPKYVATAARAADFVLKNLRTNEGRLYRTYGSRTGAASTGRLNGYLDDYAYLAHGFLCLHDATSDKKWLDAAREVTDTMVQWHADKEAGGFFYTSTDHEKLFARMKDQYDSAQPSGNSVAARNLVRLWKKTGDTHYRDLAEKTLKSFAASLKSNPTGLTAMAGALALLLDSQEVKSEPAPPKGELVAQAGGAKKSDSVVKVEAKAVPEKPGADGKQVVTLTLTIDDGWHIYANPPGLEDLESVQTTVAVKGANKPEDVKIDYPKGKLINDPVLGKYNVYENTVTIKATVRRAAGDTGPLEVTLKFQSCNEKMCLLPATKTITIP